MPKQKNSIPSNNHSAAQNPSQTSHTTKSSPTKTFKAIYSKSITLRSKLETNHLVFKTQSEIWTKEIQALSNQITLIESNLKNSQIIFSGDFRKNYSEIVKRFNKIKEGVDGEQTTLNKIMEDVQILINNLVSCKKKPADFALEGELKKNISNIETFKTSQQKLIQDLLILIMALEKRVHITEEQVNQATIEPHIIELQKMVDKLNKGLEQLCKEMYTISNMATDTPSNTSTPNNTSANTMPNNAIHAPAHTTPNAATTREAVIKLQPIFLQLYTSCKQSMPLMDQSQGYLLKGLGTVSSIGSKQNQNNDTKDSKESHKEKETITKINSAFG